MKKITEALKQLSILIIALLLIFFAGFFLGKTNSKKVYHTPASSSLSKPVVVYKDSEGNTHSVFNQSQNTIIEKKELLQQVTPFAKYMDSVSDALDIKPKQIVSSATITTQTSGDSIKFLQKQVDSLRRLVYYYSDKNLKLTVRAGNPSDTLDKGSFDFAYDADLKINQYWKRKPVLGMAIGSKQYFTDISSNDPRTTIGGFKTITVKRNMPPVGFRLQALVNYSFETNSISPGIGFRFDYDKFSLNGNYYYSTYYKEWRPVLSLRYDIIQF